MASLRFVTTAFACFTLVSCASKNNDSPEHPGTADAATDSNPPDAARPASSHSDASQTKDASPLPGPVCKDPGPTTTGSIGRRVLPWTLLFGADAGTTAPDAGAAPGTVASDAGAEAGQMSGSDSGRTSAPEASCKLSKLTSTGGTDVQCRGWAVTRRTESDLELVFADGSTLRWDPAVVAVHIAAPDVRDRDSVWVDYEQRVVAICPFCGSRYSNDLQIRRDQEGQILWMGREGSHDSDVDGSLVSQLFGVAVHTNFACSASGLGGACFTTDRRAYDHVLATDPEQTIEHAKLGHVVTPGGAYDVFWTHTMDTPHNVTNCFDGPEPSEDNTFAVSRTAN